MYFLQNQSNIDNQDTEDETTPKQNRKWKEYTVERYNIFTII